MCFWVGGRLGRWEGRWGGGTLFLAVWCGDGGVEPSCGAPWLARLGGAVFCCSFVVPCGNGLVSFPVALTLFPSVNAARAFDARRVAIRCLRTQEKRTATFCGRPISSGRMETAFTLPCVHGSILSVAQGMHASTTKARGRVGPCPLHHSPCWCHSHRLDRPHPSCQEQRPWHTRDAHTSPALNAHAPFSRGNAVTAEEP